METTIEKNLIQKITDVDKEYVENNPDAEITTVLPNEILIRKRVEYFQLYRKYLEGKPRKIIYYQQPIAAKITNLLEAVYIKEYFK